MNSKTLREYAGSYFKKNFLKFPKIAPEDTTRLIYELGEHQIKLEIQNEELQKKQFELERAREKYSNLYNFAPNGSITLDQKGFISEVNHTGESMLGVQRSSLVNMPFSDLIPLDFQDIFHFHRRKVLETRSMQSCELNLKKKDGKQFYVQMQTRPVYHDDKLVCLLTSIVNISKRKHAEDALINSENLLLTVINVAKEAIISILENGSIILFNPAAEKMFGYKKEQMINRNLDCLIPETHRESYNRCLTNYFTVDNSLGAIDEIHQFNALHNDGHVFPIEISFAEGLSGDQKMVIAVGRDISHRKEVERQKQQLEKEIQKNQKMRAISSLAGGIAHQFNNTLVGVVGNAELLNLEFPHQEKIKQHTECIIHSAKKMTGLTSRLLAYAQGGKYQPKKILLRALIEETLPLVRHKADPAIYWETSFSNRINYVKADKTQLQMVMTALVENAVEAVKGEGCIKIILDNKTVDGKSAVKEFGNNSGDYVCFSVMDDGIGMEKEVLDRIFEPFFTTHFQGRGLGMAAVYGIVRNHDGWIKIDSGPGKGTNVTIYIPAVTQEIKAYAETSVEFSNGTSTILLIEDEKMVMNITEKMLESIGYNVLTAQTGKKAINILNTFKSKIDLAILDIELPDICGKDLYSLLIQICPELKVIVCSGYSSDGPAQEILNMGAQAFIQKPFRLKQLSSKIKELIDRRKTKRFIVKNSENVSLKTNPYTLCSIIDISQGGLSFSYDGRKSSICEVDELAIHLIRENFTIDKLPCKTVSDLEMPNNLSSDIQKKRRKGMTFVKLSQRQVAGLENFTLLLQKSRAL